MIIGNMILYKFFKEINSNTINMLDKVDYEIIKCRTVN